MFRLSLKTVLISIGVIFVVVFLILPITIPYTVEAPGKVYPVREWIISRTTNGQLITVIKDHETGITKSYSISEFERGDAVQLSFRPGLSLASSINANDTIGAILSNEIQLRLTQLSGLLEIAKADLNQNITGAKVSEIKEAEQKLALMKKQSESQHKIFDRQKALYERQVISQEEYEIVERTTQLDDINIEIAEAQLQSAKTGSKQEQLDYFRAQIKSFENEIEVIKKRATDYNLISPFSGIVNQVSAGDTLIVVADTSKYIVLMPVQWKERADIQHGAKVKIISPPLSRSLPGLVQKISKDVKMLSGNQVILVSAETQDFLNVLAPGLMVKCEIYCGDITIADHIQRFFNLFF